MATPRHSAPRTRSFAVAAVVIPYVYYAVYLEVDMADFGAGALVTEAFMPGLALFVLVWTAVHTARNGTPEAFPEPAAAADPMLQGAEGVNKDL
jgi:hypothetical protein